MSIPSPKAEPLKLWLASLGKQAIDEAENSELLSERQAQLYKAKGYNDEWVKRRMQMEKGNFRNGQKMRLNQWFNHSI